jgi:hypothetical protein
VASFEEVRKRAKEQVKTLWPRLTPREPSEEALSIVTDIAAAVAWYELQRARSEDVDGCVSHR